MRTLAIFTFLDDGPGKLTLQSLLCQLAHANATFFGPSRLARAFRYLGSGARQEIYFRVSAQVIVKRKIISRERERERETVLYPSAKGIFRSNRKPGVP